MIPTRRKTLLAALDWMETETVGQPLMRLASIEVCRRELLKPRRQSPHAKRWAMDCLRKYEIVPHLEARSDAEEGK